MPRIGRLHIPGGYYHLIGRGLERRYIFETDVDKNDILSRFGVGLARANARCLAWALMSNHYHFLVQVSDTPLPKLMASVLSGFASSYNRRHMRSGYVFQNRYKSILIDADTYFLELVRYIHLNPVRAGILAGVKELKDYPWTGHAGMLGRHQREWHCIDEALPFFGRTRKQARLAYLNFVNDGETRKGNLSGGGLVRSHGGWQELRQLRREHTIRIGDERILGSSHFVESALCHDDLCIDHRARLISKGWNIHRLTVRVCALTGISKEQLRSKARGGALAEAKSILSYLGAQELGLSLSEIACYLSISQPSVSAWVRKGEDLCKAQRLSLGSIDR